MGSPDAAATGAAPVPPLSMEERRWLHDKYERLAEEEGNLLAGRTSYYATICAVLITGLVFALANLLHQPTLLADSVFFLAGLGILLSVVWAVLTRRTTGAQHLWREAALRLEDLAPPLDGELRTAVSLRSGSTLEVNLLQPYHAHRARFEMKNGAEWMERVNPATVSEILPVSFVAIWSIVLVVGVIWVLFYL